MAWRSGAPWRRVEGEVAIPEWSFMLVPVLAAVSGALIAVRARPGPVLVSGIQHFAAGVVFAAAAGELLPEVVHGGSVGSMLVGGAIGVAAVLSVSRLEARVGGPAGLVVAVGVDVLIDGLVLGIGFAAGTGVGVLLTIALTLEVLFLGLTVATELGESVRSRAGVVAVTAASMLLLPAGALLARPVVTLPGTVVTAFFAFGLIALLYLVTEELLAEAHQVPDRTWVTALFFVGFLALLALEEIIR